MNKILARLGRKRLSLEERFWEKVDKKGDDECWEWKGGINTRGYGSIWFNGKTEVSHKISYILTNGSIPEGLFILHKCNNPPCVNPKHLYAGTLKENMEQMINDGRSCTGENHWCSKLNWEIVNEIREEYANDKNVTMNRLSSRYSVTEATISLIINNEHWVDSNYKPVHRTGQDGENGPRAKLTWNKVREIRKKYSENKSQKSLAYEYRVSDSTISYIVTNKTWKEQQIIHESLQ